MPNSRNATMIDSIVKIVRTFLRHSPVQMSRKYFMSQLSGSHGGACGGRRQASSSRDGPLVGLDEPPLVDVQSARGVRSGKRIVGDHDDGLALLAIQDLQQPQNVLRAPAVKIPRGL